MAAALLPCLWSADLVWGTRNSGARGKEQHLNRLLPLSQSLPASWGQGLLLGASGRFYGPLHSPQRTRAWPQGAKD